MIKATIAVIAVLCMIAVPAAVYSDSILWDLIIRASLEDKMIAEGEAPMITGKIVDHAAKPVQNASIITRLNTMTYFTSTDQNGYFEQEMTGFDGLPRSYIINIKAVSEQGDIGLETMQLQVTGDVKESEILLQQIETVTAQRYIQSNQTDFVNDPIGLQLYHYYQGIYENYQKALVKEQKQLETEIEFIAQKMIADKILQKEIQEENPGSGVYEGWKYQRYIDSLDDSIKDLILQQLNFTKTTFFEAQKVRDDILNNGGSIKEANSAYLERLTITQAMMESVGMKKSTNATIVETQIDDTVNAIPQIVNATESVIKSESIKTEIKIDGVTAKSIEKFRDSIFVNINGTIVEFKIDEGDIFLVTNSTK